MTHVFRLIEQLVARACWPEVFRASKLEAAYQECCTILPMSRRDWYDCFVLDQNIELFTTVKQGAHHGRS